MRQVARELKKKWEGIKGGALATPPGKSHGQYKQQKLWTSLIAFERSNPLKLEKESGTNDSMKIIFNGITEVVAQMLLTVLQMLKLQKLSVLNFV